MSSHRIFSKILPHKTCWFNLQCSMIGFSAPVPSTSLHTFPTNYTCFSTTYGLTSINNSTWRAASEASVGSSKAMEKHSKFLHANINWCLCQDLQFVLQDRLIKPTKESLSKQSSSTAFYMQHLTISPSLKGLPFLAKMWEIS